MTLFTKCREVRPLAQGVRWWLPGAGEREAKVLADCEFSVWGPEKALGMDSGED